MTGKSLCTHPFGFITKRGGRIYAVMHCLNSSKKIFPELSNFGSPPAKPGVYFFELKKNIGSCSSLCACVEEVFKTI
jgi:hypothetical protein